MDRIATLEAFVEKSRSRTRSAQEKLAELKKKRLAMETDSARKHRTRAQIILGAVLLKGIQGIDSLPVRDPPSQAQLLRLVDACVTARDREFLVTLIPEVAKGVAGQATETARPEPRP